jgi:nucleotide-binding universal stress UspA family protein
VTAAEKEGVDLLIAGALEGKDVASRSFLGAVARPLAKLARCSLLLLTHPQIGPNPFRRIVVITDFSDCAKTALKNALWLAEADSAELVQVISIHTPFMQCDFTQSIGAELLVVPAPEHAEGVVPSMMDWALQVTPCSLWIVRES